jgi:lipoprotein signal peptidase
MTSSDPDSAQAFWLRPRWPAPRSVLEHQGKLGPGSILLALLAAVVVVDQTVKWWAWRHASATTINSGGDVLVGATIGGWFADPVKGALLDLLDFGLLSIAASVLLRRRRPVPLLVTGSLMIGGWSSNLLDRLVMHYWTAPGSVRGAVDFIQFGEHNYNVADLFIIGATPLFLLTMLTMSARRLRRPVPTGPARHGLVTSTTLHRARHRNRVRIAVLAGTVGLTVAVGLGAANDSGATTPAPASAPTH